MVISHIIFLADSVLGPLACCASGQLLPLTPLDTPVMPTGLRGVHSAMSNPPVKLPGRGEQPVRSTRAYGSRRSHEIRVVVKDVVVGASGMCLSLLHRC